jgi:hypothetical protein
LILGVFLQEQRDKAAARAAAHLPPEPLPEEPASKP